MWRRCCCKKQRIWKLFFFRPVHGEVSGICNKCGATTTAKIEGPFPNRESWQRYNETLWGKTVPGCTTTIKNYYECSKCHMKYNEEEVHQTHTCYRYTSFSCSDGHPDSSSGGTCTYIKYYEFNQCHQQGSAGACTNRIPYTYYSKNCGF